MSSFQPRGVARQKYLFSLLLRVTGSLPSGNHHRQFGIDFFHFFIFFHYMPLHTMKLVSLLTIALAPSVFAFAPSARLANSRTRSAAVFVSSSNNDSFDFSFVTDAADRAMKELSKYDASKVQKNLQQGEMGKRGEVYFAAQAFLVVAIVLGGIPVLGDPIRLVLSPVFLLGGLAIGLLSIVDLGSDSLSPFPKPTDGGTLKTTGVYSQMRHPMYSALLSVMLGLAMVTDSIDRLLLTAVLWYILDLKTDKEEVFLMETYGEDYADYKAEVPQKFLPAGLLKIMPWSD